MENDITDFYNRLESSYSDELKSYDKMRWGKFSAKFNRELNDYRRNYDLHGLPDSVEFDLGVASGTISSLWSEYNASLEGRRHDEKAISTFKSDIDKYLSEAKEKLQ